MEFSKQFKNLVDAKASRVCDEPYYYQENTRFASIYLAFGVLFGLILISVSATAYFIAKIELLYR